ncbi:MAG: universal stress protein [Desulfovibrionaceae bacterium]|jgi:nucleotide-binding universal stress UspA family protein|nr:universal stress protein [Desulfovibrionaceae bacterium]
MTTKNAASGPGAANERHLLLAVDGSENAARALDYVAGIVAGAPGFSVHLLHVRTPPERDLFAAEGAWRTACAAQDERAAALLHAARERLVERGVEPEAVSVCDVRPAHPGPDVARAILEARQETGCGTVVLGRRGVSKAQEFLCGSVSGKVVREARDCTVWVVE